MKIVWGKDKLFIIKEIQPKRVQSAIKLVESAIQGKIGFCWRAVPKIPMHEAFEINNKIERRKRALMNEQSEHIISYIRDEIKELKQKAKEYVLFDGITEKKLKRNYNALNKALILLSKAGTIESYTLLAQGRLKVNWFSEWQRPVFVDIRQRFICTYNETLAIKTETESQIEYASDKASWPKAVKTDLENGIVGNIKTQGVKHKPNEGHMPSGPAGLNPVVLRYRQDQKVQIPKLKEVSKLLEGLEPEDIIRVCAYLMYLKERYKI